MLSVRAFIKHKTWKKIKTTLSSLHRPTGLYESWSTLAYYVSVDHGFKKIDETETIKMCVKNLFDLEDLNNDITIVSHIPV